MRRFIESLKEDLSRNQGGVSKITVVCIRMLRVKGAGRFRLLLRSPLTIPAWCWLSLLMGAEIPGRVPIGDGLCVPHGGRGIIIHPEVTIGVRVIIYHGVTLGVRGDGPPPRVGDDVYIGARAQVLGPITIGDGARIGAGAIVTKDVAAGETRVGFP